MRALFLLLLSLASLLALSSAQQCGKQAHNKLCPNNLCCSKEGYCGSTPSHCCDGCQSQCDKCITNLFSSSTFDSFLLHRNDLSCPARGFYTYAAFLEALEDFPEFGTTGDVDTRKKEIAAFFAQTSYQTSGKSPQTDNYSWGYCLKEKEYPVGDLYCVEPCERWPCVKGKKYFGRGPMMLSYNYNYGPAGNFLGLNLLGEPELVSESPVTAFETALWVWMTPQRGKPSCHDVVVGNWQPTEQDKKAKRLPGFGVVTNIINGEVCGRGKDAWSFSPVMYYVDYCIKLGVYPEEETMDCYNQRPFPQEPPPCEAGLKLPKATYSILEL